MALLMLFIRINKINWLQLYENSVMVKNQRMSSPPGYDLASPGLHPPWWPDSRVSEPAGAPKGAHRDRSESERRVGGGLVLPLSLTLRQKLKAECFYFPCRDIKMYSTWSDVFFLDGSFRVGRVGRSDLAPPGPLSFAITVGLSSARAVTQSLNAATQLISGRIGRVVVQIN